MTFLLSFFLMDQTHQSLDFGLSFQFSTIYLVSFCDVSSTLYDVSLLCSVMCFPILNLD